MSLKSSFLVMSPSSFDITVMPASQDELKDKLLIFCLPPPSAPILEELGPREST